MLTNLKTIYDQNAEHNSWYVKYDGQYRSDYIKPSFTPQSQSIWVKVTHGARKGTVGLVCTITPVTEGEKLHFSNDAATIEYRTEDSNWRSHSVIRTINLKHAELYDEAPGPLTYINTAKKPQPRVSYHLTNALGQELLVGQFVIAVAECSLVMGTIEKVGRRNIIIGFGGRKCAPDGIANVVVVEDLADLKETILLATLKKGETMFPMVSDDCKYESRKL